MTDLKSMTLEEITAALRAMGEPSFRGKQVFTWLHRGITDFDEMMNIPKSLREKLRAEYYITVPTVARKQVSKLDGTIKYLWELQDGNCIETVLMSYHHGNTVCISSQVGCRMGCKFCASTLAGKVRDLTPSEMLDQVLFTQLDSGREISNIVLMGIGEPMDNRKNVLRFLELINHPDGMNIGMRHISLSTCGVVPGIDALAEDNLQLTLSVSLHAPDSATRSRIMPVNNAYDVEELFAACHRYFKKTGRRISFEYAMIDGVNDHDWQADLLAEKIHGMPGHVNLIPLNDVVESEFKPSKRVAAFQKRLESHGLTATVRRSLGGDIDASCGQLRRKEMKAREGVAMRACGKTDVGLRRHENQDTFAVEQGKKLLIAVVCDGMGGAEGGQIASSVAVETFMKEMHALIRADMTAEQLRELASFCVAKANTAVYQRALQDPAYQGMGTTLVSAVAEEKYAIVCNIGDSRAYLIRGGEITRITHDHSVVQTLVENGNITAEEARTHPNRNLITRALGPDENTLCDAFEVSFTKGDKILLCTDGLVVTATDDEICRAVCAGKSAEESLDDLIALAKAQGAPDNVTAVLIEHE